MSSNKILLVNKKSSKKSSIKPQVQPDASQTKPALPTSQTTTKLDNKLVRVSSPLRSGPAKVAEPVNHSVRSNQMTSLQSVLMGGMNAIDHKVTNIFKGGDHNDLFGINQPAPDFHLDVADDINAHGEYYLNGYPLIPVGTIIQHAGVNNSNNALDGWLLCDGSVYNTSDYSRLFDVIGTTYGTGSVVDTFRVPNLIGRIIVGKGSFEGGTSALGDTVVNGINVRNWDVGETGGEPIHALTSNQMPEHNHGNTSYINDHDHQIGLANTGNAGGHSHTTSNAGGDQYGHNNMQPFIVMNYYIRP